MRLLLLVHGLAVGGTEVMVSHLARRFRKESLQVAIGCLDQVGDLGRELAAEGFSVELYSRRPGFDPALPFKIARSVRRGAIDLLHAHQYTPYFYGVLAKVLTGVPLIFTEHGRLYPDPSGIRRRVFNFVFSRHVDRVTAVSRWVRESLHRVEGFDPAPIEIIYNGVDVDRYASASPARRDEARRRLRLPREARVVGTVGRLDPIKNHLLLLGAFRDVLAEYPETFLVVVGDGPERPRLEVLVRDLGISRAVRFLGSRLDVAAILPAFDVFVLSSFSESMPMTIIEAMAASVPIVSTAVGGVPEILRDGREAFLVTGTPPDCADVHELEGSEYFHRFTEALKRALREPELSAELARRALERVRRHFSLESVCRRYLTLYREVVPEPAVEGASSCAAS